MSDRADSAVETRSAGALPVRVLVVDDQPLVREGIAGLLAFEPLVQVVARAADGWGAVEAVREHRPDVVLMDVRMPGMGGIEATGVLAREGGGPPVILLTTFEDVEDMIGGVSSGARGYLFKTAEIDEIRDAILAVHRGETVFHPRIVQVMAQHMRRPAPPPPGSAPFTLTAREVEILSLLALGRANRDIAEQAGITEGTVKLHVSRILGKLEVSSRLEAVIRGSELGLIRPLGRPGEAEPPSR